MSGLMQYKPGNDARDFFKRVHLPLEPGPGQKLVMILGGRVLL